MIVDTSALLCVLFDEPEAAGLLEAIVDAPAVRMSAANWLEVAMIVEERGGRLASLRLDEFVRTAGIEVAPVTVEQAAAARNAWRYFGRHKHSARLDFGDCFAYALAKTTGERLLYTGEDFARTDVEPALPNPRGIVRGQREVPAQPRSTPVQPASDGPGRQRRDAPGPEQAGPERQPAETHQQRSVAPGPHDAAAPGRHPDAPGRHTACTSGRDTPGALRQDTSGALRQDTPGAPGQDTPGALRHDTPGALRHDIPGALRYDTPGALRHDIPGALRRDAADPKDR